MEKEMMKVTAEMILKEARELHINKNNEYGNAFRRHGEVMKALLPDGIELKSKEEFEFFTILDTIVGKINRIVGPLSEHMEVHIDSLRDIAVYAAMAQEIAMNNKDKLRNI